MGQFTDQQKTDEGSTVEKRRRKSEQISRVMGIVNERLPTLFLRGFCASKRLFKCIDMDWRLRFQALHYIYGKRAYGCTHSSIWQCRSLELVFAFQAKSSLSQIGTRRIIFQDHRAPTTVHKVCHLMLATCALLEWETIIICLTVLCPTINYSYLLFCLRRLRQSQGKWAMCHHGLGPKKVTIVRENLILFLNLYGTPRGYENGHKMELCKHGRSLEITLSVSCPKTCSFTWV